MNEIEAFVRHHSIRHPELRRRVQWADIRSIAAREGLKISILPMSRLGRLINYEDEWEIQLSERLDAGTRAVVGMHELVHFWRDREEGPAFYSTEEWQPEPREDFANMVAWYCTSSAYEHYARPEVSAQDE